MITIHLALCLAPLAKANPDLISKQHGLLHPAWLSHIGHKRPGVKPGLPLNEAKAKAAALKQP